MYKKPEKIDLKCKQLLQKRNNVLNFCVYPTKLYTQKSMTIEKYN